MMRWKLACALLTVVGLVSCNRPSSYLVDRAEDFKRHFCQQPEDVRQGAAPELVKLGFDPDRLAKTCQ